MTIPKRSRSMMVKAMVKVMVAAVATCAATVTAAGSKTAVASPGAFEHQGSSKREDSCRGRGTPPTRVDVPVGGTVRSALVHVPAAVRPNRRAPLVLSFHGAGSTADFQAGYDGVNALADTAGFIAVHPQGVMIDLFGVRTVGWDIFSPGTTEPAFVRALLDMLDGVLCVNRDRVYATGISNGGGMVELLACTMSDRIAAVAPVAALPAPACPSGRPVPTIAFHGRQDLFVPYDGIPIAGIPATEADLSAIAARNGCSPSVPAGRPVSARVARLRWADCDAATVLYRLDGQGHSWPGHSYGLSEAQWVALFEQIGPPPGLTAAQAAASLALTNNEIDATALSWSFFNSKRLAG